MNKEFIPSPCISVCLKENDVCVGCFRTSDEITGWKSFDNTEKLAVLAKCEERSQAEKKDFLK